MKIYVNPQQHVPNKAHNEPNQPQIISGDTLPFTNDRRSIYSGGGLNCSQCGMKSKHGMVAYCFIHKRMVAMNETCPRNTRQSYKNLNF